MNELEHVLATAFMSPSKLADWLSHGASPSGLKGEIGALLSSPGLAEAVKMRLSNTRAFIDRHNTLLVHDATPMLPHAVWQLAAQEPDAVFGTYSEVYTAVAEVTSAPHLIEWLNKPQVLHPCQLTIEAKDSVPVLSVAYSNCGSKLARAEGMHVVVCDAMTGFELHRLTGHTETVMSVAWSQDGTLATGSRDNTLRIWSEDSTGTFQCKSTLTGHSGTVRSVAWSNDGKLASGSYDSSVKIWVMDSSNKLKLQSTLTGHSDPVQSVAWSNDGKLASGSDDRTIRIWSEDSSGTFNFQSTLTGHSDYVRSVAWSEDGPLASGSDDKTV